MANNHTKRGAQEGIAFGLIAGVIFAVFEVIASAAGGNSPLLPFRMFASVLLGQEALTTTGMATAFIIGTIVHLVLSAVFGLIYGIVNAQFSDRTQSSFLRQAGIGLLYGALLWVVNLQIIARLLYPWFLEAPQLLQRVLHAVFYGLPLGLMYAGAERRAHYVGEPAPQAP